MKTKLGVLILIAALSSPLYGQGSFSNLNFENANVVVNDPTFGALNWGQAAPGWSHSSGNDTSFIYYQQGHVGFTQEYMLYDSLSPSFAPGTQLAGNYSLGFSSGHATGDSSSPWVQAYLAQTGFVANNVQSLRFLATGSFQVFFGGIAIPVESLGGNAYAADISAFAGTTAQFKIVNTALTVHTPVLLDNVVFSPVAIPEPSTTAMIGLGGLALCLFRRKSMSGQKAV